MEEISHQFAKKLKDLSPTSISIQSLSKWMLFNSKRGKELVRTWSHEATNAPPERKLNFLYLANDCLQQAKSKNKSDAFLGPFHRHLPEVLAHIGQSCKHIPKTIDSVRRTVKIWEERQVYDSKTVAAFLAALSGDGSVATPAGGGSGASGGSGGGSARLGAPALKGPAADLAAKLGAVQRLAAQCRAVRDQVEALPPAVLAGTGGGAGDAERGAQLLDLERGMLAVLPGAPAPPCQPRRCRPPARAREAAGVSCRSAGEQDYKKEVTVAMSALRDVLQAEIANFKDNDARIGLNEERRKALAGMQLTPLQGSPRKPATDPRLDPRLEAEGSVTPPAASPSGSGLQFQGAGGSAPPPMMADSDDDDGAEPDAKRPRLDSSEGGDYEP